jgi:hypothetical protein
MLMTRERRPAIRTLRGWAISVLREVGANAGKIESMRLSGDHMALLLV